jgi:uncharacterized Zn finger protein (UPF0148 family)
MELNEVCDVCGSPSLREIKCKVICQNCGTILKSCTDLLADPYTSNDKKGKLLASD